MDCTIPQNVWMDPDETRIVWKFNDADGGYISQFQMVLMEGFWCLIGVPTMMLIFVAYV